MNNILIIGSSGYIGSALNFYLHSKNIKTTTIDLCWFSGPSPHFNIDYKNADKIFLEKFSHIVLLAGHSSMLMCSNNYQSAWNNNITNFSNLISKLNNNQTLIYASSGSVYGQGGENRKEYMTLATAQIEYDLTKQIREKLAIGAQCKTIGLRFGTVNGFNKFARKDLMLNAMVSNALEKKSIDCYNGTNHRSILSIDDCVRAIHTLIMNSEKAEEHDIYNLASFSGQIKSFAKATGDMLNVPVNYHPEITNNFSFELNCDKFVNTFDFKFEETIEKIITKLVDNYSEINWSVRTDKKIYV